MVSVDDQIAGLRQLIGKTHEYGLTILGCTISPMEDAVLVFDPLDETQAERATSRTVRLPTASLSLTHVLLAEKVQPVRRQPDRNAVCKETSGNHCAALDPGFANGPDSHIAATNGDTKYRKSLRRPIDRSDMASENAFLARKAREIALIQGGFGEGRSVNRPASAAVAMEEKFRLAAELRAMRSLDSWAITETARPEVECWHVGAYRFSFGYQRADLEVQGPPIYDALHGLRGAVRQKTFYTGSGMSAITAAITAVLHLNGELEILMAPGLYNETRELLASFGDLIRTVPLSRPARAGFTGCRRTRLMLLDSSVSEGFDAYRRSPRCLHAVLFDTTCYTASSARIGVVIDWALRSQLPIVLVRSHAKLDSLGIEYGRLGSIVLVWPRSGARMARIESLSREIADVVRLHGVAAIPAHFPPFSGTDEYRRCTRARTASIIRATRSLARRLAASLPPASVRTFQHGLYLALVPDRVFALGDVKRLAGEMCDALAQRGLPVRHAGSFGFDFVAVEWFPDPVLHRKVVRVAGGDLPRPVVDRIGDGIATWWSRRRIRSAHG